MTLSSLEVVKRGLEKVERSPGGIASFIDSTLLKQVASLEDAARLLEEASKLGFRCSVLPSEIAVIVLRRGMAGDACVAATIGFPLGASTLRAKLEESREALEAGARELDLVVNLWLGPERVEEEVSSIASLAERHGALVKVIIEAPLLSDSDLEAIIRAVKSGGGDVVKTSTGVYSKGGDPKTVARVYRVARAYGLQVKAAGGIRTALDAIMALGAGADIIGTSSARLVLESMGDVTR